MVGVLADIFGLVSGVQGFLKGEVLLMVLAAIAILLITCSWLWRERHKLALGAPGRGVSAGRCERRHWSAAVVDPGNVVRAENHIRAA